MNNKIFEIHFGALAPTIAKQLKTQGFKFNPVKAKRFQELFHSIMVLSFGGIFNDSERKKAQDKLYKKITKHVSDQNNIIIK